MMYMVALVQDVEGGALIHASYCDFVFRDRDYQIDLLPRLVPLLSLRMYGF